LPRKGIELLREVSKILWRVVFLEELKMRDRLFIKLLSRVSQERTPPVWVALRKLLMVAKAITLMTLSTLLRAPSSNLPPYPGASATVRTESFGKFVRSSWET
jgi:hypothetical protein